MEEFNAAQERLEPTFGNRFVNLDRDEAGEERPVHKEISMHVCGRV
jgi:hypothetical protein